MTNKLQQAFAALSKNLFKNSRQRREAIEQTHPVLAQSDKLFIAATFFLAILLPLLLNPTLLFDLPAWIWWMKTSVWLSALARLALHLLVVLYLAPAQLTGATVDAIEQATPADDVPVFFPAAPVQIECEPLSRLPDTAEQKAGRQAYWLQQWRRMSRKLLFALLVRRQLSLPTCSLESAS
jgi:hypothetical protein